MRLHIADSWVEIDAGRLVGSGDIDAEPSLFDGYEPSPVAGQRSLSLLATPLPVPTRAEADELLCISAWLDEHASIVRLAACEGIVAESFPPLPSFAPKREKRMPTRR